MGGTAVALFPGQQAANRATRSVASGQIKIFMPNGVVHTSGESARAGVVEETGPGVSRG